MIPKEIIEKVDLVIKFNDEILEYLKREYNFSDYIESLDIVDEPSGKKLQDGSYKARYSCGSDNVYYRYYPMDNGRYLEISYTY